MSNNEEQKVVYPEQENPARPTYEATVRGHVIGGFLYYAVEELKIVVTIDGHQATARPFAFVDDESRKMARRHAKNLWRSAVLAVLGSV
jgi:hypothetical protein